MIQDAAATIFVEYQAITPAQHPNNPGKRQISIEEIADTFQTVAEDIQEIGKLTNQENSVVPRFLKSLKMNMEPWASSIAVSYRTLIENRYLLNKIDEEHAAQTKQLVEKGTSAIETLMRSMANIEKELSEAQAVKVSYRHPMQKMAQDQKVSELTQRLDSAKNGWQWQSVHPPRTRANQEISNHNSKRKPRCLKRNANSPWSSKQERRDLANEIAKLKMTKTSNPLKKVAIQQQVFETEQKFFDAKKRCS